MKTNTLIIALYGNPGNVERLSGHYKADFETKQQATYSIENGLATITELSPVICTHLSLPLPFVVPVNDLGSGHLQRIDINADTLLPHPATCPTNAWADRRTQHPLLPDASLNLIMADYSGLH
ncbi:hypothetical protein [Spirosoma fluminis]